MSEKKLDSTYEIRMREIEMIQTNWNNWCEFRNLLVFKGTQQQKEKKRDELKKLIAEIRQNAVNEKNWWKQFDNMF